MKKKKCHANGSNKKVEVAIPISDKTYFKTKSEEKARKGIA